MEEAEPEKKLRGGGGEWWWWWWYRNRTRRTREEKKSTGTVGKEEEEIILTKYLKGEGEEESQTCFLFKSALHHQGKDALVLALQRHY